jgi:hypothetical protein
MTDLAERMRHLNFAKMSMATALEHQDELPQAWRELIYDHGQLRVFELFRRGYEIKDAREMLKARAAPEYSIPHRYRRR